MSLDFLEGSQPEFNLAADQFWNMIVARPKAGDYDFMVAGTPCKTFLHARHVQSGLRPLRSAEQP